MKNLKRHILVVDDDEVVQAFLKKKLSVEGYDLTTVSTAEAALHRIRETPSFDLILCDLKMPRMSGLDLLGELKSQNQAIPLILMTAHGSLESAIHAMREGAFDYILKPLNVEELLLSLDKALRFQKLEQDNTALRKELKQTWENGNMIGKSPAIHAIFDLIKRVAPTQANVLIHGESGTGKELVARALHFHSVRKDGPFVAINCAAIPSNLLESELFGHTKGAFTGAHQAKKGLFEEAQDGTIFLDEIGDLDFSLQAKLLRVIQERKVRPIGETVSKSLNVRIVAATHKDLRKAAQNNQFREDLYYRLCVIPVEIPPLRQRKDDILLLADHFLKKYTAIHGLNVTGFSSSAMSKLIQYGWPGNVRELENVIERSVILATSEKISDNDISISSNQPDPQELIREKASKLMSLEEMEKHYIGLVLDKTGRKKERAAQILGIDRKTLRRKIKDFGLMSDSDLESQSETEMEAELQSQT
jgi:DNA-binding NtrC family response regulator